MFSAPINLLTVLVAALINMVIGALWYSPVLFAKPWMKLIGKKEADMNMKGAQKYYLITFVGALVMAYILAHFIIYTNSMNWMKGAQTGFWVWLGFVATTQLPDYLFAGRPLKLYAINSGYYFVSLLLMGALLAVWR